MTCGCSGQTGPIVCRNGTSRDELTVTRAVMCATCPYRVSTGSQFSDGGNCGISGNIMDVHVLHGVPCPQGRHPNKHGLVTLTMGHVKVTTHHAPYWLRVWLLLTGGIRLSGFRKLPGCGCIVRAKRRWRQLFKPRLWYRMMPILRHG